MPANHRSIGSEGLEQGGPDLGNDYTRSTGTSTTGARDAIIVPHEQQREERSDDTLNMDNESSRNLSGELTDYDTDPESVTDDDDIMEDTELQGLDTDDDEDDDEDDENDII